MRITAHTSTRTGSARACGHPERDGEGLLIIPPTRWYQIEEFNDDLSPATDPDRRLVTTTYDTPLLKDAQDESCGTPTVTSEDDLGSGDDTRVQLGEEVTQGEVNDRAITNAAAAVPFTDEIELVSGASDTWYSFAEPTENNIIDAQNSRGEGTAFYKTSSVYFSRIGSKVQVKIHYQITNLDGGIPVGSPTTASVVIPADATESSPIDLTALGTGIAEEAVLAVTSIDAPDIS